MSVAGLPMDASRRSGATAESPPTLRAKLVNFAVFQVVYFACVFGAAQGNAWIGPLSGLVLLPLNLAFVRDRGRELRLWLLAGLVGLVIDTLLLQAGVVAFPDFTRIAPDVAWTHGFVPLWIVTLWVAFGSLLTSSLAWLGRSAWLAVLFGALGGPFSFWSGSKIGATELPEGWLSFVALGAEYAILLPILLRVARRSGAEPGRPTPLPPQVPANNATAPTTPQP